MYSPNPRDQESAHQTDSMSEQLADLQQADVSEREATQVKGGEALKLNPQPLPPSSPDDLIA